MVTIKIFTIGKNKEAWLEEALATYTQRLKGRAKIEWHLAKDDAGLIRFLEKEREILCLDPAGKALSSLDFSRWIASLGSRLTFVIGGVEGIPEEIRRRASTLLSLSPLTLTHQLTRLVLLEQLYRAFEIARGSPYHR